MTRILVVEDDPSIRMGLEDTLTAKGYHVDVVGRGSEGAERALIARDYFSAFAHVDLIALPTSPVPAFKLGERVNDPLQMYLADIFTVGANLAGIPGISVPCGMTSGRLPIGLQLLARPWEEATMLKMADAYENQAMAGRRTSR